MGKGKINGAVLGLEGMGRLRQRDQPSKERWFDVQYSSSFVEIFKWFRGGDLEGWRCLFRYFSRGLEFRREERNIDQWE